MHGTVLHEDEAGQTLQGEGSARDGIKKTTQRVEDFRSFSPPTCQLFRELLPRSWVTAVYQSAVTHARELKRAQNNSGG